MNSLTWLLLLIFVSSTQSDDVITVPKCCGRNQQFHAERDICVTRHEMNLDNAESDKDNENENEENDNYDQEDEYNTESSNNGSDYFWLPDVLRRRKIVTEYNTIRYEREPLSVIVEANESNIQQFLKADFRSNSMHYDVFAVRVHPEIVWRQFYCFEATGDPLYPHVIYTSLSLADFRKCCGEEEILNPQWNSCEALNESVVDHIREDNLDEYNSTKWMPTSLQDFLWKVEFETLDKTDWTVAVNADNDSSWKFIGDSSLKEIWVSDSYGVQGSTSDWCFDMYVQGSSVERILLASITKITKCCQRDQQLNSAITECVRKSSGDVRTPRSEVLDLRNMQAPDWIPKKLYGTRIPVAYGRYIPMWGSAHVFRVEEIDWRIDDSENDESVLYVQIPTPSGNESTLVTKYFCLDAVENSSTASRVLLTWNEREPKFSTILKCCSRNELLLYDGNCLHSEEKDWSPLNSSVTKFFSPNRTFVTEGSRTSFCSDSVYYVENLVPSEEVASFLMEQKVQSRFSTKYYCADLMRAQDGSLQEGLAYCAAPPNSLLFEKVRPLQVLAAVLLAMAVAAILTQKRTRYSTHGRALACHAICLMAANSLQVAWFFTHERGKNCDYYSYAIYFFLISGAFWLNAISLNMARGFWRPPGGSSTIAGRSCRQFGLFTLYALSIPAILTAVGIYMHRTQEERDHVNSYLTPTFMETRTCLWENIYSYSSWAGPSLVGPSFISVHVNPDAMLGSVVYYFAPLGVLVLVNTVCLILTLCKIRFLRKGSSILNAPRTLLSAMLYVKLLLTAGVVELAVEATAWASRRQTEQQPTLKLTQAEETAYFFAIVGTWLDLARACAVLWLCVARCSWLGAAWRRLREWRSPAVGLAGNETETTPVPEKDISTYL